MANKSARKTATRRVRKKTGAKTQKITALDAAQRDITVTTNTRASTPLEIQDAVLKGRTVSLKVFKAKLGW